jgi:hypothetical protein
MERTNKIYVIGTLTQVKDTRSGTKDGVEWVAGTSVVTSGTNEFEFKFYAAATTQKGKDNSRFSNYKTLSTRIGERVKVNGEVSGRLWFNEGQGQIINFNELTAGFFNTPKPTETDTATFEYSGFVTKPIYERHNKDEVLVAYEMEIGQANYAGTNMQIVKFTIDKDNPKIISAIEKAYAKNTTVFVSGAIRYEVIMEEKVEEVAFGDPIVKKYQNTRKSFVITGGKQPIVEEGLVYTPTDISKLQAAYNDYLAQVEKDAKDKNAAGGSVAKTAPAASNNQDRLL